MDYVIQHFACWKGHKSVIKGDKQYSLKKHVYDKLMEKELHHNMEMR